MNPWAAALHIAGMATLPSPSFHLDGLRAGAVAFVLCLDCSRWEGEWVAGWEGEWVVGWAGFRRAAPAHQAGRIVPC